MILAGIDIGTNTLRLLIAEIGEDTFHERYSDTTITRLGQDLERTGELTIEAMERSIPVLAGFAGKVREHSAVMLSAVGTSALRKAGNREAFIRGVRETAGIDITVINGEEEARLTLLGVGRALRRIGGDDLESALVMDIGGGSTEVIKTRHGSAPVEMSIPIGAVYLTERFIRQDPPTSEDMALLRQAVRDKIRSLDNADQDAHAETSLPGLCVGTAGTSTTLAAMDQEMNVYDPEKINGYTLGRASLDRIVEHLTTSTLAERREIRGLEKGREDIILAGAVVAQEIMGRYEYNEMIVSDWGLREGIVLDLYEQMTAKHHISHKDTKARRNAL
ncbi:MAG TPA: hypothetical protein DCO77_09520 [Nitrospiraceae bacterium]|nr:hypothetical protein [Nitrospiraceae bacterium]